MLQLLQDTPKPSSTLPHCLLEEKSARHLFRDLLLLLLLRWSLNVAGGEVAAAAAVAVAAVLLLLLQLANNLHLLVGFP